MAYYDNRQFNNMKNDAVRRTRQMYQNSMVNTSHYSQADNYREKIIPEEPPVIQPEIQTEIQKETKQEHEFKPENHTPKINNNHTGKSIIPENLSRIIGEGLDSEKLTIIALIIILAKEGADMKLILALGYILI